MLLISFSAHQGGPSLCSWLAHLILSINGPALRPASASLSVGQVKRSAAIFKVAEAIYIIYEVVEAIFKIEETTVYISWRNKIQLALYHIISLATRYL